jgi:hypothetical protein
LAPISLSSFWARISQLRTFSSIGQLSTDIHQQCSSRDVRWGDVNGHGLGDFICLDVNGIHYDSMNRAGNPSKFESIGAIREQKTTQSRVRLADIDGDGRLD